MSKQIQDNRIIKIAHGDKTAFVVPVFGMNTCRLAFGSEEILRSPASIEELAASPNTYGTPLLMPPGRVVRGRFAFEGEEYYLPINEPARNNHLHGFLSGSSFDVIEQTANSVIGEFTNNGEIFPFPYRIRVECMLDEYGYQQKFIITNTGAKNMPLAFGLHTCFLERDYIKLPINARVDNGADSPLDGTAYQLDAREQLLARGGRLEGEIDLGYKLCGHEILIGTNNHANDHVYKHTDTHTDTNTHKYCLSDNFTHLTIWNADARSGFIAIEPQQGAANAFNNGCGLKVLAPGESEEYWTVII